MQQYVDLNTQKKKLHLVGKMINYTDKPIVDWPAMFKKELFVYTELIPAYKRLEQETGIKDALDIFPKFIGYRYSLDDTKDIVDEHSVLLMENLKACGYYNGEKKVGLNLEHAKTAISCLARYHALGIGVKHKYSNFFEKVLAYTQVLGADFTLIDEGFNSIIKIFHENASLRKHLPIIEASFAAAKNGKLWTGQDVEPWVTVCHGDFWVNNMMFHKNENGQVDGFKFVDFQTYLHANPLKDVSYFFIASIDEETRANRVDELLDLYHEIFLQTLKGFGCDVGPFDKEALYRELKFQAIKHFPICALAIKFFLFEITEEHKSSTILKDVIESRTNDDFVKKMQDLVKFFETRGWF